MAVESSEKSESVRKVGFFELQLRTMAFVITFILLVALMHNVIWNPDDLSDPILIVFGVMAVLTSWNAYVQAGYYKVPGNKSNYCGLITVFMVIIFALIIHLNT